MVFVASTHGWDRLDFDATAVFDAERRRLDGLLALAPQFAGDAFAEQLTMAADQFVVLPGSRVEENIMAQAEGSELRSIYAGYHWFTDWGRDTMISLEGLTLTTGRHSEAGYILRTFAHYVRDGLIPEHVSRRRAARASITRPTRRCGSSTRSSATSTPPAIARRSTQLLPDAASTSSTTTCAGTRFGIGVDPSDGLLRRAPTATSSPGWTPRSATGWSRRAAARRSRSTRSGTTRCGCWKAGCARSTATTRPPIRRARRAGASTRSTRASGTHDGGYLYDVVDGETGRRRRLPAEPGVRDLAAASGARRAALGAGAGSGARAPADAGTACASLAPGHPDYKAHYYGDLRARDAAYHQGTVWAWLIGPFVDAWLRVHPDDRAARADLLRRFRAPSRRSVHRHASAKSSTPKRPSLPRGCIAQAWSVAEVLRAWLRTR